MRIFCLNGSGTGYAPVVNEDLRISLRPLLSQVAQSLIHSRHKTAARGGGIGGAIGISGNPENCQAAFNKEREFLPRRAKLARSPASS
jgi:hypothetical protein